MEAIRQFLDSVVQSSGLLLVIVAIFVCSLMAAFGIATLISSRSAASRRLAGATGAGRRRRFTLRGLVTPDYAFDWG